MKKPVQGFVSAASLTESSHNNKFWRGLEEWRGVPAEPTEEEDSDVGLDRASRRRVLQLMAGSLALAGLTGCTRQPTETIMPYVEPPEQAIPGKPLYYATAVPLSGIAQGVIVESHLGRPTKVEGNPDHPGSLGAASVHSQACLLDLYDPDRASDLRHGGESASWEYFLSALEQALTPLRARGGQGFRILTETVVSPSLGAQIRSVLAAYPKAKWHQWEPIGRHSARAGSQMVFGRAVNTYFRLDRAEVVAALDSDFLACGPASTRYARDFINGRRIRGDNPSMNRLYCAESAMTSTGGKADHRIPVKYAEVELIARDLAAATGVPGVTPSGTGIHAEFVAALARDLTAHRGAGAVMAGEEQSPTVHALAHAMNAALGNVGNTVMYTEPLEIEPADQLQSLRQLAEDMDSGAVDLLFILGGNPVYNAPYDFDFRDKLRKVPTSVHIGLHFNETSFLSNWHIPETHFLEDWGDSRAFDGTVAILQPLIYPLYDAHSYLRVLDPLLKQPGRATYDILQSYWKNESKAADFEHWWRKAVHDGLVAGSALPSITPAPRAGWANDLKVQKPQGLELVLRSDPYIYDGRFANNIWLQELPRPMSKLTWDNAVKVSPRTAQALHLENQHVAELHLYGRKIEGSVWILPGHPDGTISVELGYGRTRSGRAGNGAGFDAYPLRRSEALWTASGLQVRNTGRTYPLATTQMQQTMEGRDLVVSETLGRYQDNPDFMKTRKPEPPTNLTLYPQWNYTGYAWGMSIDLTACVNCNACVVACQAENNIPVVGKEQVLFRRAMHWLRIDTYYRGDLELPQAVYQPVPCMQCENAPCELVCPVQATNHSRDGLNDMVYNRCVGTRYCSNNCPYKVRRFNFLRFADWSTETYKLQRNPDVTVRSRGVMEKCSYCVQRIREAEILAATENRFIRDGEIQTACQQTCPTQAIVFGDINNRANRVAKLKAQKLDYALLAELNTRPRTTYLAELRNPNPELGGRDL